MLKRLWLTLLFLIGNIIGLSAQLTHTQVAEFESLLTHRKHKQAIEFIHSIDSTQKPRSIEKGHSRLLLAKAYGKNRQFDLAESLLDSLLSSQTFSKHTSLLAEAWLYKGSFAIFQNKEAIAIDYLLKVDSIADQNNTVPDLQIRALNTVGGLLFSMRYIGADSGYSKPSHFFDKALNIAERIGDSTQWYNLKIKLAFFEFGNPKNKHKPVPPIFDNAISYFEKEKEIDRLIAAYKLLPQIHIIRGNLKEAEAIYKEYIRLSQEYDITSEQANAYWRYGVMLENSGRIIEAIDAFEKAKKLFEAEKPMSNIANYNEVIGSLAKMYRNTGRFEQAFDYLGTFHTIKDSLDVVAQQEKAKELDTKYQTAEKNKEITLLEMKNQQKSVQILLVILGGLLIAVAALFYFYRQQQKIKLAKQISELDSLKRTFFANISHEFRTPLTLIKSPAQHLRATADENAQKHINLIENNANRMMELVDQLLELSKIDSNSLQIILKKGKIHSFLHSLVEPFEFQAKENNIQFEAAIKPTDESFFYDKDIFTKTITNLLNNAFKYHDLNTPILFHSHIKDNQLHFEVSNINSQIKESELKKIFERFYQKNSSTSGDGIGLALVRDLVEVYEGTITPHLENDKIIFSVVLPLDKNKKNAVIIEETKTTSTANIPTIMEREDLPVLLIADDNADIRMVLVDIFASDFVIVQAENGKKAYEIAQREVPDCIIADVMMPEMDGYLLVRNLKENEITATIPVILLTAKTTDQDRLQGVLSHADAFLTKPFNHEIVKATVEHQIQERKKLQERYSKELVLKPVDIILHSADEK
ncbi:MAG TPA: response regulator, partial [Flavobacteriaceae bacterium]|nr:response regulator [Flavobacteriaceae bacterium]